MPTYDFIPCDTLFCRDQRPLKAGFSYGRGANLPLPTVLHSAIRTALLAARPEGLPERQPRKGNHRRGVEHGQMIVPDYQWLNLVGPFPVDEKGVLYFPCPRDLVPGGDGDQPEAVALRLVKNPGGNNLPAPLTHLAMSPAKPSKLSLPAWVPMDFFEKYLRGETPLPVPRHAALWDSEHRICVRLDEGTLTAAKGQLYAAEHLRTRDGVNLRFRISTDPHQRKTADLDGMMLQVGGERRFGSVKAASEELKLPSAEIRGCRVKWVLLSPAIFAHGWRPGWVDEGGKVRLRIIDKTKRADRRRPRRENGWEYRETADEAEPVQARLIAAVVGKAQVIGGWDIQAKPTFLAVPSGSVYYFEAANEGEARKLARILQGRCRSDFFGEKGLGLGVCGNVVSSGDVPGRLDE